MWLFFTTLGSYLKLEVVVIWRQWAFLAIFFFSSYVRDEELDLLIAPENFTIFKTLR